MRVYYRDRDHKQVNNLHDMLAAVLIHSHEDYLRQMWCDESVRLSKTEWFRVHLDDPTWFLGGWTLDWNACEYCLMPTWKHESSPSFCYCRPPDDQEEDVEMRLDPEVCL